MKSSTLTALLARALGQAHRRGGGVRIDQLENGWETSIAIGARRVVIARDEYLENALMRLSEHAEVVDR